MHNLRRDPRFGQRVIALDLAQRVVIEPRMRVGSAANLHELMLHAIILSPAGSGCCAIDPRARRSQRSASSSNAQRGGFAQPAALTGYVTLRGGGIAGLASSSSSS
jgi:hypothetical protein